MSEETLRTREGEFVTKVAVPPFQVPCEVIVWGSRVFVLRPTEGEYFEVCAHVIPIPA